MEYNKPWIFFELIPFVGLGIIGVSQTQFVSHVFGWIQTNRYGFAGLHRDNIHQGEHLLVPLPEVLQAGSVPSDGGAGGDPSDRDHRLSKSIHQNEHQPVDLLAIQPVRHI